MGFPGARGSAAAISSSVKRAALGGTQCGEGPTCGVVANCNVIVEALLPMHCGDIAQTRRWCRADAARQIFSVPGGDRVGKTRPSQRPPRTVRAANP